MKIIVTGALALLIPFFTHAAEYTLDNYVRHPGKKVICAMTLNSSDEKREFEKHLPDDQFDLVELVPESAHPGAAINPSQLDEENRDHGYWFASTCDDARRKNLQCDALIISGHYGGTFWGSSGKNLDLEVLESDSCSNSCAGILSHPSAVYLFGCNLLADKTKDHRSPEEYLRVLVDDGVPRERAERVVEARYGPTEDSNSDRTRRIFSNSVRLFGFNTTSPQGPQMRAYLERYFRESPHYFETLAEYQNEQVTGTPQSILTAIENDPLRRQRIPGWVVQSGMAFPGSQSIAEEKEIKHNSCVLTTSQNLDAQLMLAAKLLTQTDYLRYFAKIIGLLENHFADDLTATQQMLMNVIRNNTLVKNEMKELLKGPSLPDLHIDWADFSEQMNWITHSDFSQYLHQSLKRLLTPKLDESAFADLDRLHRTYPADIATLSANELDARTFLDESGIQGLEHLAPTDGSIHARVASALLSSADLGTKIEAAEAIEKWHSRDPQTLEILSLQLGSPILEIFRAAKNTIASSETRDPKVWLALARQWRNRNADNRLDAMITLAGLYPSDPAVLREIKNGCHDSYEDVRDLIQKMLSEHGQSCN